jgi:hypothetical protein
MNLTEHNTQITVEKIAARTVCFHLTFILFYFSQIGSCFAFTFAFAFSCVFS